MLLTNHGFEYIPFYLLYFPQTAILNLAYLGFLGTRPQQHGCFNVGLRNRERDRQLESDATIDYRL